MLQIYRKITTSFGIEFVIQSGFRIHLAQEAKKPRIQLDLVDFDNRPDAEFVIVESTFFNSNS